MTQELQDAILRTQSEIGQLSSLLDLLSESLTGRECSAVEVCAFVAEGIARRMDDLPGLYPFKTGGAKA